MDPLLVLLRLIRLALQAYEGLIIATVLLSWFTLGGTGHPSIYRAQEFLHRATDPFIGPIRQALSPITSRVGLDFSPILAILLLSFIARMLP
jgi:uncharacterized protein YggT (Ycf19 family)